MYPAPSLGQRARITALLAFGALAVHQARYLLAPAASDHGHEYLNLLAPVIVAATFAAIGVSIATTLARRRLPAPSGPEAVTERAVAFAIGLLAVYFVQEAAEGLLVGEHGPFAGLVGPGGWLALPLSIALGAFVALAGQWLDRTELRVAIALLGRPARRARCAPRPPAMRERSLRSLPLAFGLAARPPPAPSAG
jgi:hypothetical protein